MSELLLEDTGNTGELTPFWEASLNGYAKNKELYSLGEIPSLSDRELYALQGSDYATVFYVVMKKFLGDTIPDEELQAIANLSFHPSLFGLEDGKLPMRQTPSGIYIADLSSGPTGSFKDVGIQPSARLIEAIRKAKHIIEILNILISTSGDTAPAAQFAYRPIPGIRTITMFPADGTSEFQRAQMIGMHDGDQVHSIEVDADFTAINDMHLELEDMFDVGAVNSANIARLLSQVPYHVATYLRTIEASGKPFGDEIDISIPSGNFGNAMAAIIARAMGVPIRNIIIATDENDVLSRYFNTGIYPNIPKGGEKHTTSSAQDIRNASNLWRYFHMLYGGRNEEIYNEWKNTGAVDLRTMKPAHPEYRKGVKATTVDELARQAMMQDVWDESKGQMMIDPHTANAVVGATIFRDKSVPMAAYETAKPFKFPSVMKFVLGVEPPIPERFSSVMSDAAGKEVPHAKNKEEIAAQLDEIGVKRK